MSNLGLLFDILGVILLFKFPLLAPKYERNSKGVVVADDTVLQDDKTALMQRLEDEKQKKKYSFKSKIALFF